MPLPSCSTIIVLIGLAAFGLPAAAQFKWTGPDGKVIYSDSPPPPGVTASTLAGPAAAKSDGKQNLAGLAPIAAKYPVVLYTTSDCSPCQQARSYLTARGIPFSEKTIKTPADADAFRAAGLTELRFPTLGVGREHNTGFEQSQWSSLLDAAGYYSYKWAEVLSADCYAAFEEEGLFNAETGQRFLREILSVGGSRPAIDSFKAFRGREPSIEALLRHNGMVEETFHAPA